VREQDYQPGRVLVIRLGLVLVIRLVNQLGSENQPEQGYLLVPEPESQLERVLANRPARDCQLVLAQDYQLVLVQDYQLVLAQDYQPELALDCQLEQCRLLSGTDNRCCRWQVRFHCPAE
jgi:hypothetical protein